VKIVAHNDSPTCRDRGRQIGVDSAYPGSFRPNDIGIEVEHLPECVNAGIGPTGAESAHWNASHDG
jgi:hypothetical protein